MARIATLAAMLAGLLLAGCITTTRPSACDRACLSGALTTYLNALLAHDPGKLPLAKTVRFTEDGVDKKLGEGLWTDASGLSGFRFDIIDVRAQNAASLVKVEAGGKPVLLALRLHLTDGKIDQVETMPVRSQAEGMIFRTDAIVKASPAMTLAPPKGSLNKRDEMAAIAVRYPEGLKIGSFVKSDVPFTDDAYRFENGQLMAGPGCTFFKGCDHIKTQTIPTLKGIKYYVAAVDEEQGVVLLRMDFGPGSLFPSKDRPAGQTLSVFEAFKVYGGQVHAVEAFMKAKPGDAALGWEPK
jgi:hypothetical protein